MRSYYNLIRSYMKYLILLVSIALFSKYVYEVYKLPLIINIYGDQLLVSRADVYYQGNKLTGDYHILGQRCVEYIYDANWTICGNTGISLRYIRAGNTMRILDETDIVYYKYMVISDNIQYNGTSLHNIGNITKIIVRQFYNSRELPTYTHYVKN